MRKPLSQRQFLDAELLVVQFDNSSTPTVASGGNQVTVTRSAGGGTRDRTTITFKKPMAGMRPRFIAMANTADCQFKEVSATVSAIVIDAVKTSNASTVVEDPAGTLFIVFPTVTKEGSY